MAGSCHKSVQYFIISHRTTIAIVPRCVHLRSTNYSVNAYTVRSESRYTLSNMCTSNCLTQFLLAVVLSIDFQQLFKFTATFRTHCIYNTVEPRSRT
jgi:hypothetical protein